jgi:hypothetical protein
LPEEGRDEKVAEALMSGRRMVTAECLPPADRTPKLSDGILDAAATVDAVVVADNPDVIRGSAWSTARLLAREGRRSGAVMRRAIAIAWRF